MLSKWGQRFSPLSLFAAGEQGGWWDPSDFSTMFQDSAGTTPVTAVGQPVGLILDKSGRGNHLRQGTAASRPTLQQDGSGYYHLLFDGVDDGLVTAANVDFTGTNKATIIVSVQKASDAARGTVADCGVTAAIPGFRMEAPNFNLTGNYGATVRGATGQADATATTFTAPNSAVVSNVFDSTAATTAAAHSVRVNGATPTIGSGGAVPGGGNMSSTVIGVGRTSSGTNPFNGRVYSLVIRGASSTAAQIAQAERYAGSKMGIVL